MRQQIELLPADSYWHSLAKLALSDDLNDLQRSIALEALGHGDGNAGEVLDRWEHGNRQALDRAQRLLVELQETPGSDLAMLSVALRSCATWSEAAQRHRCSPPPSSAPSWPAPSGGRCCCWC
ncbi:hypothetical protein HK415_19110 [Ramlibacter sp. B156]|uniref:NAD-specific glutamate dehydrogenase C-terminal domain-containing protein n=2 Tax=Ramlibacter montanisoli TaxID=2732512 RepID=A0A849KE51_9BURK|nr:hypothetical protein [Ramlibacter montanisoli]